MRFDSWSLQSRDEGVDKEGVKKKNEGVDGVRRET